MSKLSKKNQLDNRLESLFEDLAEDSEKVLPIGEDSVPGWTWKCDPAGNYISCSPEVESILGYPPAEFLGQPLKRFALPPHSQAHLEETLKNGSYPAEVSVKFLTAQGETVIVKLHVFSQNGEEDAEISWHGFAQAIEFTPAPAESAPPAPSDPITEKFDQLAADLSAKIKDTAPLPPLPVAQEESAPLDVTPPDEEEEELAPEILAPIVEEEPTPLEMTSPTEEEEVAAETPSPAEEEKQPLPAEKIQKPPSSELKLKPLREGTAPLKRAIGFPASKRQPATLTAPIDFPDHVQGMLEIIDESPGRLWSDDDLIMVEQVADQLSLALENANLFQQTQDALSIADDQARRLALLNNMSAEISLAADLEEIYQIVVNQTNSIFPSERVSLTTLAPDGKNVEVQAVLGEQGQLIVGTLMPLAGTANETAITNNEVVFNPDTRQEDQLGQIRSFIVAPISVGGKPMGTLNIGCAEANAFDERDLAMMRQLTSLVGAAIENRQLFQQTQIALSETDALYQASAELNVAQDYEGVLDVIHKHTVLGQGSTFIALDLFDNPWTEETPAEWIDIASLRTEEPMQQLPAQRYRVSDFATFGKILNPDETTVILDIANDPNVDENTRSLFLKAFQVQSTIFTPIVIGGQWIGMVNAGYPEPTTFPQADLRRLNALIGQAAVVIDNLKRQAEERSQRAVAEQLAEIARQMAEVTEQSELHQFIIDLIYDRVQPDQFTLYLWNAEANAFEVNHRRTPAPDHAEDEYQLGDLIPVKDRPDLQHVFEHQQSQYVIQDWVDRTMREHYCVPWRVAEQVTGVVEVFHTARSASITDADQSFIEGVIRQAATALERARLFQQTQDALGLTEEQARRLAQLNEMSEELSRAADLDEIRKIAIAGTEAMISANRVSMATLLPDGEHVEVTSLTGEKGETPQGTIVSIAGSLLETALQEKDVVINPDLEDSDLGSLRTSMVAPLMIAGEPFGTLNLGSYLPDAFDLQDQNLIRQIASLLSAAIENRQLLQETQQRASQLQTAAEVSRAASSTLDPNELLQQVVDVALERFKLYYAGLFLRDESGLFTGEPNRWAVLRSGTGAPGKNMIAEDWKLEIGGGSMVGAVMSDGKARVNLRVGEGDAEFRPNPHLPNTRSEMALPLISRNRVLGVMTIQSERPDAFTEEDIVTLQTMADQVANAFANAQLFEQAQLRAEELNILNEMGNAFTRNMDVESIISNTYNYTSHLMEAVNFYVALYDPQEEIISFPLTVVDSERVTEGHPLKEAFSPRPIGDGLTDHVIKNRQPILIKENALEELEKQGIPYRDTGGGTESWLGVPLMIGNQVLGVIAVQSETTPNTYDEHDRDLLTAVASQAAIAIQNARLFQQEQDRAQQEYLVRTITERVRQGASAQEIVQIALTELGEALGARKSVASILPRANLSAQPQEDTNHNAETAEVAETAETAEETEA